MTEYHIAKVEIRVIRSELRKLAHKTVFSCKSMKTLIEHWDEKENAFVKQQFKLMRKLLEDSLKTLNKARSRYIKAIDSINKATEQLRIFSEKLNKMTDKSSAEHEEWTSKARTIAYTSAGGVSIGLVVADIFGCLGICSAVGSTTVWGATLATLEIKIAEYTAALEALEKVANRAKENIVKFNAEMDSAKEVLTEEIQIIEKWEAAAEKVQNNIDSFSVEDLKAFAVFQQIFVDVIEVLQKTAEDYLEFTKFAATDDETNKK